MRILAIDASANCLDWLMRCQTAGHEVLWYIKPRKDGTRHSAGDGIVPKVTDLELVRKRYLGWADLIYSGADNAHYTEFLDPYRKMGYPVFGASPEAAELELNRAVGQKTMKACGIPIMDSVVFDDYDRCAAYVRKHSDKVFVSKPSGDADKAMSYVADSAADMCFMLSQWKKNEKLSKDSKEFGFILQEKKKGYELAVGGWFGPGGWSKWFCENAEYKKVMDGDLGDNCGEKGTLVRLVRKSKLADQVLLPLTPVLERMNYVGYIDNNCIIDEKGHPWPLELTVRDGWPLRHNIIALQEGDPAQWMVDLLLGHDTMKVTKDGLISISIVMSREQKEELVGYPVYEAHDMEHVHLSEVALGEAPVQVDGKVLDTQCFLTSGNYVLVVTGTGETITGARKSAYAAVKKIKIPKSPGYRLDIGKGRMVEQLPKLQALGYLRGMSF